MSNKTHWRKYTPCVGGSYLPYVSAILFHNGHPVRGTVKCIVDTGAGLTLMPRHPSLEIALGALLSVSEQPTSAKDANGAPVTGIPIELDIQLEFAPHSLTVKELVWVSRSATFSLLGQTWLEKIGANFQNFPGGPNKRQFGLYKNPF